MLKYIPKMSLVCLALWACKAKSKIDPWQQAMALEDNLQQLSVLMEGVFDNERQHKAASADFLHVVMRICRIWKDRSDGAWYYVEQHLATLPQKPYRQRVYRLRRGERDTLLSEVYMIPQAQDYIGRCGQEKPLGELRPKDLSLREGCEVYLVKKGQGYYEGTTRNNTCPSNLRGAAFVRSWVSVSRDTFLSWDRGLDSAGVQVWGADERPYVFDRKR